MLLDIANEEKEHIGELTALIKYLDPDLETHLTEGAAEVFKMMDELGIQEADIVKATGLTREEAEKDIDN